MRCDVCGEEYGTFHDCRGASWAARAIADEKPPPLRFAPLYYLRQAFAIARFDETAILRASRDNNALLYGIVFWFLATIPVAILLLDTSAGLIYGLALIWLTIVLGLPIALLVQVGVWVLCHLVARVALHGRGSFAGIVRAMLLGSVVGVIAAIPVLGPLIAGLWGLAILMVVFEAIHGIRRIHAFAISFGIGLIVRGIGLL